MNEAIYIQPLKAMMHGHKGTLSTFRPDAPQNWLQADAMFIFGPQFDRRVRVASF
jgi:hypothetical protein